MCDTYLTNCDGGCGGTICVHIADFCVNRDHVKAFCPRDRCRQVAMDVLVGKDRRWLQHDSGGEWIVFADEPDGNRKRSTLFIVERPRGIRNND